MIILTSNSTYSKKTTMIVFCLNDFLKIDHRNARKFIKNELLQIVQTFVITNFRPSFVIKKNRKFKTSLKNSLKYFIEWITNKTIFKKILNNFYTATKIYKTINQYHNFSFKKILSIFDSFDLNLSTSLSKNSKTSKTLKKKNIVQTQWNQYN